MADRRFQSINVPKGAREVKQLIFMVGWVCFMLAMISIFAYAAFDFAWWKPLKPDVDVLRALTLFLMHVVFIWGGLFSMAWAMDGRE